jgi:hypothetical protein
MSATDNRRLNSLFEEFNRLYFNGGLPRYRVQIVDRIIRGFDAGRIKRRQRLIQIRRGSLEDMAGILLHEMAHAATNNEHAKRFQDEMRRLRAAEAPLAQSDRQESEGPTRLTRTLIRDVLEKEVFSSGQTPTLWQFVKWFHREYRHAASASALLRRHPWVRKLYSEAKREHQERARRRSRLRGEAE